MEKLISACAPPPGGIPKEGAILPPAVAPGSNIETVEPKPQPRRRRVRVRRRRRPPRSRRPRPGRRADEDEDGGYGRRRRVHRAAHGGENATFHLRGGFHREFARGHPDQSDARRRGGGGGGAALPRLPRRATRGGGNAGEGAEVSKNAEVSKGAGGVERRERRRGHVRAYVSVSRASPSADTRPRVPRRREARRTPTASEGNARGRLSPKDTRRRRPGARGKGERRPRSRSSRGRRRTRSSGSMMRRRWRVRRASARGARPALPDAEVVGESGGARGGAAWGGSRARRRLGRLPGLRGRRRRFGERLTFGSVRKRSEAFGSVRVRVMRCGRFGGYRVSAQRARSDDRGPTTGTAAFDACVRDRRVRRLSDGRRGTGGCGIRSEASWR